MSYSVRLVEREAVVGSIPSVSGVGSYYSNAVSLSSASGRRFEANVNVGTIGASATVDFEIQWSATSGGTYATAVGSAIPQDTAGSKVHRIEVTTEQIVQKYPTAQFIKGYLKTLVAATPTGVTIRSSDMTNKPITDSTSVVGQTITTLA